MKEDLKFHGKQFNQVNSVFTAGYIIGLWPNNLILQVVPPRWWLPFCGSMWGILSACLAAAKTPEQVMVIRFLQALFESSTFTGCHWILGSWYKEEELGKEVRNLFDLRANGKSLVGSDARSDLQTMNGHLGLKSYQWLFIIDFCLAMPIALFGFFAFPDTPRKTKAWFLSEEERALAIERLPQHEPTKMSWNLVKRVFGRWHIYLFGLLFGFGSMLESAGINSVMGFWFKSMHFAKAQINYYPLSLIPLPSLRRLLRPIRPITWGAGSGSTRSWASSFASRQSCCWYGTSPTARSSSPLRFKERAIWVKQPISLGRTLSAQRTNRRERWCWQG